MNQGIREGGQQACPHCGSAIQNDDRFCTTCGGALPDGSDRAGLSAPVDLIPVITTTRIIVLSILTYGLYLFYWSYITWKQYGDHTRSQVYPIWHALSFVVPIYSIFRIHAHATAYHLLLTRSTMVSAISPTLVAVLFVVSNALDWASFRLQWGVEEVDQGTALLLTILGIISIALGATLIQHVQENINAFWAQVGRASPIANARLTGAEGVLSAIGLVNWFLTLGTLLG